MCERTFRLRSVSTIEKPRKEKKSERHFQMKMKKLPKQKIESYEMEPALQFLSLRMKQGLQGQTGVENTLILQITSKF
jgi:hypothetical protein